jgi:RNA polymerase sigma-70 factor (ECF subfamily)
MIDWEGMLKREGPAVWKTAWKVLGNRADADECFQEACLAAVEYSKTHAVRQWRPLLHQLATARAIDRLRQRIRRRNKESAFPQDTLASAHASPLQTVQDAELAERIRLALVELPAKQAEVFCLFHMNGWSYLEIAESLNVSADLVGVWLLRARERLRKTLSENEALRGEALPSMRWHHE